MRATMVTVSEQLGELARADATEFQRTQVRAAAEILANIARRLQATYDDAFPAGLREEFVTALSVSGAPTEVVAQVRGTVENLPHDAPDAGRTASDGLASALAWARATHDERLEAAALALADSLLDFELSKLSR